MLFSIISQAQEFSGGLSGCGTIESPFIPIAEEEKNFCFDIDEVLQNQQIIWLKVNFHFFLNDAWQGTLDPLGIEDIPYDKAYEISEDLINRSNQALEDNRHQWNQNVAMWFPQGWTPDLVSSAQFVPFRYVLSGVYLYNSSAALNVSGSNPWYFQNNFAVNPDSEFNAFFIEWAPQPGINANGQATGTPGKGFTIENFSTAVFNHEMGHVLGLFHSWRTDYLTFDDTPAIQFKYDFNCDGDLSDNWNAGIGDESEFRQCWFYYHDANLASPPPMDYNGDGIVDYPNPCDMSMFPQCVPYPCCDWRYINNNIMAYTSYTDCCAAYTKGQINGVLEINSVQDRCDYIESITSPGDCPPPMANIHILPLEEQTGDCSFCFQLGASMHDDSYRIDFYSLAGNLIHSTGWKTGSARSYCISKSFVNPQIYQNGFIAGLQYDAVLSIQNACGELVTEKIRFLLPDIACDPGDDPEFPLEIVSLYPNPFTNEINMNYKVLETGTVEILLIDVANAGAPLTVQSGSLHPPGNYQHTVSTAGLPSGLYALTVQHDNRVISLSIIKN